MVIMKGFAMELHLGFAFSGTQTEDCKILVPSRSCMILESRDYYGKCILFKE